MEKDMTRDLYGEYFAVDEQLHNLRYALKAAKGEKLKPLQEQYDALKAESSSIMKAIFDKYKVTAICVPRLPVPNEI